MERWRSPLIAFILRYLGNREDAIDLAQETFVRVYEHRHSFKGDAKFSSWLFSIAANLCRNQLRWRSRHPAVSLDAEDDDGNSKQQEDDAPSPAENAQQGELARAVQKEIQALPHDLRVAVILSVYEERSHGEIAEVLKCSAKAVESRLYRAREILREALKGESMKYEL
jgi:RNA polymerase sigma-70 factor (ECF subfamily)